MQACRVVDTVADGDCLLHAVLGTLSGGIFVSNRVNAVREKAAEGVLGGVVPDTRVAEFIEGLSGHDLLPCHHRMLGESDRAWLGRVLPMAPKLYLCVRDLLLFRDAGVAGLAAPVGVYVIGADDQETVLNKDESIGGDGPEVSVLWTGGHFKRLVVG